VKFLCDQCKAKYQIADDKIAGKTVRMKCRKCGHQIEVRAAVTETSVGDARLSPSVAPRPLATSLATARPSKAPAAPDHAPGALAGAFRSTVQKDEEVSASFDLGLSAADEWYVAINGVPVGPIRVQEVRRKAALGAVTLQSLVWQEGMEEWRPVQAFAELAAIVQEAATSGRTSLMPHADSSIPHAPAQSPSPPKAGAPRPAMQPPRASQVPAAPRAPSAPPRTAPAAPIGKPLAPKPAPTPSPSPALAPPAPIAASAAAQAQGRNNVVPITSRLATAERLEIDDATVPYKDEPIRPSVAPDPFAMPPPAANNNPFATDSALLPAVGGAAMTASAIPMPAPEPAQRRAPPWMIIAMLVLAGAFGVTAALAIFLRPPPAPVAPVVIQMSGAPAQPAPPSIAATTAATAQNGDTPNPADTATAAPTSTNLVASKLPPSAPLASNAAKPAASSAAPGGFSLSGLGGSSAPRVGPGGDNGGGEAPKAGQCLTQGQVQSVINSHQPGVKRGCWDRNPSSLSVVSVSVMVTIGPGGEVQSVSANGADPSVAKCVEMDVRNWHFPAGGCVQQTAFGFRFLRQ
jgi:predicted Zn finger-like uncharacterized protein